MYLERSDGDTAWEWNGEGLCAWHGGATGRLRGGAPVPPSIPPRIAAQMARRSEEKPDVVLVASDYMTAVAFSDTLRWANVVEIVGKGCSPTWSPHRSCPLWQG